MNTPMTAMQGINLLATDVLPKLIKRIEAVEKTSKPVELPDLSLYDEDIRGIREELGTIKARLGDLEKKQEDKPKEVKTRRKKKDEPVPEVDEFGALFDKHGMNKTTPTEDLPWSPPVEKVATEESKEDLENRIRTFARVGISSEDIASRIGVSVEYVDSILGEL